MKDIYEEAETDRAKAMTIRKLEKVNPVAGDIEIALDELVPIAGHKVSVLRGGLEARQDRLLRWLDRELRIRDVEIEGVGVLAQRAEPKILRAYGPIFTRELKGIPGPYSGSGKRNWYLRCSTRLVVR